MSLFYLCTVTNCNKKYRTAKKFQDHMLKIHQQIVDDVPPAQEITKNNRKEVEKKRNEVCKQDEMEKLRQEVNRKKELEELARKREEEENLERYRLIEQEKKALEEMKINEEKLILALQQKCQENALKSDDCCICMEQPRNAVVVPCGHKFFCMECITKEHRSNPRKGCPICRKDIVMIVQVFD